MVVGPASQMEVHMDTGRKRGPVEPDEPAVREFPCGSGSGSDSCSLDGCGHSFCDSSCGIVCCCSVGGFYCVADSDLCLIAQAGCGFRKGEEQPAGPE